MARRQRSNSLLFAVAFLCAPLASITDAAAIVLPPDGGEDPNPSMSTGGSAGVAEPPLSVYLDRYTYYVGEIITGDLDCPDCFPEGPLFQDSLGNQITGTIIYSETNYGAFVFIPDVPLPVGIYSVSLDYASTGFEVVLGESLPPTYEVGLSESPNPVGDAIECQSTVPGYAGAVYPQSRIDAALGISVMGDSADQYQYEFSLDAAERISLDAAYPPATFRQGNGEFCVEVFAIPYTDTPEFSLGTVCMDPDVELELGVKDIPYGSIESVLAICELPPDGYMDEWCAYHAEAFVRHSCAGFVEEACVQARYECPDGDLPEWFDENGINPDATGGNGGTGGNGSGASGTGAMGSGATGSGGDGVTNEGADLGDDEASAEAGGCSCTTGVSKSFIAGNRTFLLAFLGGALIVLRRRERKFVR